MKKKNVAVVAVAGVAATTLTGGLFAWAMNTVNIQSLTAGAADAQFACTSSALNIEQNTPSYSVGPQKWFVDGVTVTAGTDISSTCAGQTLTVTALDSGSQTVAGGSAVITSANGAAISEQVAFGSPVDLSDIAAWTVVIQP